jgi:hypothetical protein
LSGIGYSWLKHLTGCPFSSDVVDCHEEASMRDSDAEGNSLSCVLKAISSINEVINPPGHDEDEVYHNNLVAVYDECPLVLNLNQSVSSPYAAADLYQ